MKKLKIKNRDAQKKRSGHKAVESIEQLNEQNRHQSQYLVNTIPYMYNMCSQPTFIRTL